jgi:hypothetical protein
MVHFANLETLLSRGALHAPNHCPADGANYRTIHSTSVQASRHQRSVPCGPRGVLHDYVPFYFGYHSPMLLQLKTGQVEGYDEGQDPLVYLVAYAEEVAGSGCAFVFSDGHSLAAYSTFYDDLANLDQVDWDVIQRRYWRDTAEDMDRQRRKQAEFLVHRECPWQLIREIVVRTDATREEVERVLERYPANRVPITVRPDWYY